MNIRRFMSKFGAVLLCTAILFASVAGTVSAAQRTPVGYIETKLDGIEDQDAYYTAHKDVIDAIYDGVLNYESTIDVSEYRIPTSEFSPLANIFFNSFPEFFYLNNFYMSYNSRNIITEFYPIYSTSSKEEATAMHSEFMNMADFYLSYVDDSMDDFTKALVLHDVLALNTYYPAADKMSQSSNYTYMVQTWGVCQHYSQCYAYLLAQCGIKSEIVPSSSMDHAWVKVCINGQYFNIDLTWDDPLVNKADRPGKVAHTYFLHSDSQFQTASGDRRQHYGYSIFKETSTAYDGYDNLHNLDNPLFYIDGKFYTLYEKNNKGYIATYDYTNDTFTDLLEIDDVWQAGDYGGYWIGNFSGIGEYGGLLYYNDENSIRMYDPVTRTKTTCVANALDDGNQLYGMYIKDGKVYGMSAPDPNTVGTPVYICDCKPFYNISIDENIAHGRVTADRKTGYELDKVTLEVVPDDGYAVDSVKYNGIEIPQSGGVYSFNMPHEDVSITASFVSADGSGAVLTGHSLTLEGDIGVYFYMELSDDVLSNRDTAYMDFTVPNGSSTKNSQVFVKDALEKVIAGNTYYGFKCSVSAKEMTSQIKAQFVNGENRGTIYTYTVKEYADYMLANLDVAEYAEAEGIVKAMLNYGAYSQVYFDNHTDKPANEGLTVGEKFVDDVTASTINMPFDRSTDCELTDDVEFGGATLSLKSKTTLSLYFRSEYELTFTCDQKTIKTETVGEYQVVRIENISSSELNNKFNVVVSYNGLRKNVAYSPLTYCYNALNGGTDNTDLQNVAKALYKYSVQANAYFA